MDLKEFITGYKGKDIPNELKEFNWGACLLTFIWGIKHKAWITLLAIPLIWYQMPLCLNWILLFILQIYCGIKGNEWAYQVDYMKKPAEFNKYQTRWASAAIIISIIIPFTLISFIVKVINKSSENVESLSRNTQCSLAYHEIRKTFPKTVTASNEIQLTKNFASRYKKKKIKDNSVIIKTNRGISYDIRFLKHEDDICDISSRNCIIYASFEFDTDNKPIDECIFFFDNRKNVIPDKSTQEAIDKGINLFKYL